MKSKNFQKLKELSTNKRGFTLIELSMVISMLDSSRVARTHDQIAMIACAVSRFNYEQKRYPDKLDELMGKSVYSTEPYLLKIPEQDPWGTTVKNINGKGGGKSYGYAYAVTDRGAAIWSFGPKKANGSGGGGTTLPAEFKGGNIGSLIQ